MSIDKSRAIMILAKNIRINWNLKLPIFAAEDFLKAVGNEYGWLGGFETTGKLVCILPFTILRKGFIKFVRFRVETIPVERQISLEEERSFLNSAMQYFRKAGVGFVIPGTTNAVFRTYPDGAYAAPYGSYVIELSKDDKILWQNIKRIYRQNISTAERDGVIIKNGLEHLNIAYGLVRDTFKRSKIPFMSYRAFERYVNSIKNNCMIIVAFYKDIAQCCTVYAFSESCTYAVYGGSIEEIHQGAMKLVDWTAIKLFNNLKVKKFDFVGARINPVIGSKQDTINSYKRRFGASLIEGYIWKYPLCQWKYLIYKIAVKYLRGGDIVDYEQHKLTTERVV